MKNALRDYMKAHYSDEGLEKLADQLKEMVA